MDLIGCKVKHKLFGIGTVMPDDLRIAIDRLLEKKKITTEKEENPQDPVIRSFIETELERLKDVTEEMVDDRNRDWSAINEIFIETIKDNS